MLQLIGSRGMRAWVSIAQLITTVVMSILRGILRVKRVKKEDNQLLSKAELVQGHEIDWLAVEISQRDGLSVQSMLEQGDTELTVSLWVCCLKNVANSLISTQEHNSNSEWDSLYATGGQPNYQNLMNLRICLAGMAGHVFQDVTQTGSKHSKVSWGAEVSKVHSKAKELTAALDQVANIFFKGSRKSLISLKLLGSRFCQLPGITNGGSEDEKVFEIRPKRRLHHPTSQWTFDHAEVEATLGLALWSLISDRRLLYCEVRSQLELSRAEDVTKKRVISAGLDPRMINGELELFCWRAMLSIQDSDRFTRHGSFEKTTLPLDTDLDGYSLGSLWQVYKPNGASEAPIKGLKQRHWLDMPGETVGAVYWERTKTSREPSNPYLKRHSGNQRSFPRGFVLNSAQ